MRTSFGWKPQLRKHGGKRRGAGRKAMGKRSGVSHKKRERVDSDTPVMLTMKIREGLPNLRTQETHDLWKAVLRAIRRTRSDFRVVHYSIMGNHLHLLAEADSTEALSSGMISLLGRFARALNKMWDRKGKVFADRFHLSPLDSPIAVRRAIAYVLTNARKHGIRWLKGLFDPFSSAKLFPGWYLPEGAEELLGDVHGQDVVSEPRSDLLRKDWYLGGGKICASHVPGPPPRFLTAS